MKMSKYLNEIIVCILIAGYILCGILGAFSVLGMEKPEQVAFAILLIDATLWVKEKTDRPHLLNHYDCKSLWQAIINQ